MCHLEAIHPMIRANTRPQATEFANGLEKHMMAWRRALTGHRGEEVALLDGWGTATIGGLQRVL